MRRYHGTIYTKVVSVMLGIIFVSIIVPFTVFHIFYSKFAGENMRNYFEESMLTAIGYLEQNNLPIQDLEKLFGTGVAKITVEPDLTGIQLSEEQLQVLNTEKGAVLVRDLDEKSMLTAVMRYNGYTIIWQLRTNTFFEKAHRIALLSLLASVIIGTLIAIFAGRKMTSPLRMLDDATKRVASGDFSLQLNNPYHDEIGSLINSFNVMTKELASVEMLRSDFVSDISHEFKTPLTAIEGYAKLLINEQDPGERREYVQIIAEETRRLSTLAQNILTMNKLEKGNIPVQRKPVRIDEQIRRALTLCESEWSKKHLELDLELDEASVNGLEPLLMQVWTNLIDNAIKFSREGGNIRISLTCIEESVRFCIQDEGKGIKPEDLNHIFDKFYKGDKSRGSDGNGLGLSITRRVVQMHGGTIRAENAEQGGARFTVIL